VGARGSATLLAAVGTALAFGVVGQAAGPAQAPSFASPQEYAMGAQALEDVAIADLNGDGRLDLAATNEVSSIYVLLNRGHGKLGGRRGYRAGAFPATMAIGDLNGDRKPDLVTANLGSDGDGHTVSVLLNSGDGSFVPRHDYETGLIPRSLAVGDLNGDGKPDLVTANIDAHSVSVLLNRGGGSFGIHQDYPAVASPSGIAIGDLNGDGKPDVAVTDDDADIASVLLNNGDASLQAGRDYRTDDQPDAVAIGDLNGDAKPDVVTVNESSGTVSILMNVGDGTLHGRHDYRVGTSPDSVAIADLNGDRKLDLVTTNFDGASVSVLANRGGTFSARRNYEVADSPDAVAIGDLNGDRRPDLAVAGGESDSPMLSVLRNATGLCAVPNVRGRTLAAAVKAIGRANCRIRTIRRVYSKHVKKGLVLAERPSPGTLLPRGGKVDLVISKGQ
jgi:hypothetical protein